LNASFDEKDIKINVDHPRTTQLKKWSKEAAKKPN